MAKEDPTDNLLDELLAGVSRQQEPDTEVG